MAICPYCGSQIGDEAEICGFCGGKLTLNFTEVPETVAREIPEAKPVISNPIPEALPEDEYEGIPDDILGGVLGALSGRPAAPKAEEIPPVPEIGELPDFPSIEEILDIPAVEEPAIPAVKETPVIPPVEEVPVIPPVEDVPVIPPVEDVPVIPPVEDVPVIPPVEDVPVIPPVEEVPVIPPVEEAPVIPVAEEAPVIPAVEQPAYAQPAYAQSVEPKKNNKWLIPAIVAGVLALICILFFALRGGGSKSNDPNVGVYRATLVQMYGIDLNADDIYEEGFIIELKGDGSCEVRIDGDRGKGTWSVEDGAITIDDGSNTIQGKIDEGVLKVENMLDMGLDVTFEKQE